MEEWSRGIRRTAFDQKLCTIIQGIAWNEITRNCFGRGWIRWPLKIKQVFGNVKSANLTWKYM